MGDITLSAGVRQNLLSLQKTADLMSTTQNRLATGKKVNSALDNPTNFFTSESLQARSNDLSSLMDAMSNGVKTLEAADNGLTAITKNLESMQSTLRQARQDKSFKTDSYTVDSTVTSGTLDISGGAVGSSAVNVDLTTTTGQFTGSGFAALDFDSAADNSYAGTLDFDVAVDGGTAMSVSVSASDADTLSLTLDGGTAVTFDVADVEAVTADELSNALNALFDAESTGITASTSGGELVLTSDTATDASNAAVAVTNVAETLAGASDSGLTGGADSTASVTGTAKTVDELVTAINNDSSLAGNVRASNDNGKLRIENLSTQELSVDGVSSTGTIDGSSSGAATIGGNTVRSDLADQYNQLRDQLDKLSDDASFNGVNLLRGDALKITFNETGTSSLTIQSSINGESGKTINASNLGINTELTASDLDSDAGIDSMIAEVKTAMDTVRSQASAFGSNLSMVQNRQDFTKSMMNTLQTGADNLVLADTNEEAANMLALQTRQQLSSTALSMASQADQAALRLF